MTSLNELYLSAGYPSKSEFRKIASTHGFKPNEISDFIKSNAATSIYDKPTIDPDAHYSHNQYKYAFMIDLMDTSKYSRHNSGIHWLLNIVEWHSKHVWSFPLKTKSAEPIKEHIMGIIEDLPNNHVIPIRIISDQGSEFSALHKWIHMYHPNIQWLYTTAVRKSTRPVERFNRTLWNAFARYWAAENTLRYLDFLPKFIEKYNETSHIKNSSMSANKLYQQGHEAVIDLRNIEVLESKAKNQPQIGQYVRYLEPLAIFDKKSATPIWSQTVHLVEGIHGDKYSIAGVPGTKLANELKVTVSSEPELVNEIEASVKHKLITNEQKKLANEKRQSKVLKEIYTRPDFHHGIADSSIVGTRKNKSVAREKIRAVTK